MNKTTILSLILIMALLLMPAAASATVVDDLNNALENGYKVIINSAKSLSLPGVGSITVKCDQGANCGQSGENWLVTMNSMSTAQTIDLTLPAGTKSITGDMEVTTVGTVTIEVIEKAPIQTVPVVLNTNFRFRLRDGFLSTINQYDIPLFERSGISSIITTNYNVQLLAPKGNSQVLSKSYDYRNPQTVNLYDGAGNMATITPSHQISGGLTTDVSSVAFVDNGYGTWEAFDKTNFRTYLDKVNDEVLYVAMWNTGSLPKTWAQFLARMKTLGLNQYTDLPLTKSGYNIIMTYPVGSVGTQLQAVIPKDMAQSITVRQHWGDPVIDSAILSPSTIIKGQGLATLTVKATNKGTTDTINIALIVNGAIVTNIVNSLTLAQNQQGTFTFSLNPTVSTASDLAVRVISSAGGSGLQRETNVILKVEMPPEPCNSWNPLNPCPTTTQKISVTAYNPDGSTLSTAPIFKNGVQVGTGKWEDTLPFGKYTISTNNASNAKLFSPTPLDVDLQGGEPKIVSLHFSNVPIAPPGADLTWIFWGVLAIILIFAGYRTGLAQMILKNPMFLIPLVIVLLILWFLWQLFQVLMGIKSSLDETYTTITTLGGLL
jgi:hypothetical protein